MKPSLMDQDDLQILRQGEAYQRYQAAYRLRSRLDQPEVVRALVEALADPSYSESPGDYDAPPLVYAVAESALESLQGQAIPPGLAEVMRRSTQAARLGVQLLPQGDLLREMSRHAEPEVRVAALERWGQLGGPNRQPLLEGLLDLHGRVASTALSYCRNFPELAEQPPPRQALENMRQRPLAGLFVQVVALFQPDQEVLRAWLELAAQGSEEAVNQLTRHRERLSYELLRALPPAPHTFRLLGWVGDPRAIPLLRTQLHHPEAVLALLRLGETTDRVGPIFLTQEVFRSALLAAHPHPLELVREVVPVLKRQWDEDGDLGALRGLEVLAPFLETEMPWLLSQLKTYVREPLARQYAISIVGRLGPQALPAFEALAVLLDDKDCRGPVLQALTRLGAVARADFLPLLLELEQASQRWLVWEKNWWSQPLEQALEALRTPEGSQKGHTPASGSRHS